MKLSFDQSLWAATRIAMGFIFLWAFLDKMFGLGFATVKGKAWIDGLSPTTGYLSKITEGPFADLFHGMAGVPVIDYLFMGGLLLIGVALMLGVATRLAGYSGAVLVGLIYLASLPLTNNPIIDEHIIYILVLLLLTTVPVGEWFGLGKEWSKHSFVKKNPFLK
jgi:thiosulfate dehydrogenase [quinone] large subunit